MITVRKHPHFDRKQGLLHQHWYCVLTGRAQIDRRASLSETRPVFEAKRNAMPARTRTAVTIAVSAMLAACAQSYISIGSWKDPSYHKKLTKVFVIGVTRRAELRREFETDVVNALRRRGVTAVASFGLVPLKRDIGKEAVKARVKAAIDGKGYDGVLVSRLIGVDKTTSYVPPVSRMDYTYSGAIMRAYSVEFTPGHLVHDVVVSIETDLYDTASEKLVWSMTSKSFNPTDAVEVIKPLSDSIIKNLTKNALI